jgi:hypothetical protein
MLRLPLIIEDTADGRDRDKGLNPTNAVGGSFRLSLHLRGKRTSRLPSRVGGIRLVEPRFNKSLPVVHRAQVLVGLPAANDFHRA